MTGKPLTGQVALVSGATRGGGRGIAIQLGAAGATVYVTGRSTAASRSPMNRPETIEQTADLVTAAGGNGIAPPPIIWTSPRSATWSRGSTVSRTAGSTSW